MFKYCIDQIVGCLLSNIFFACWEIEFNLWPQVLLYNELPKYTWTVDFHGSMICVPTWTLEVIAAVI